MKRTLAYMSISTLIISFGLIAMIIFWLTYTPKLIYQSPKPFPMVDGIKVAKQGGVLSYEYSYCKYTDIQATVSKQFIDGLIFQSEDTSTTLYKGCGHVHRQIHIPETLPPGVYHLHIIANYKINPIREVKVINDTEEFTVIE